MAATAAATYRDTDLAVVFVAATAAATYRDTDLAVVLAATAAAVVVVVADALAFSCMTLAHEMPGGLPCDVAGSGTACKQPNAVHKSKPIALLSLRHKSAEFAGKKHCDD